MTGSKYGRGQIWINDSGMRIEVLSVEGSIHGNTSRLGLRIDGHPVSDRFNGVAKEPIHTKHLTAMIERFGLRRGN
jgi:hypothetical protein